MEGAITKTIKHQLKAGEPEEVEDKPIEMSTNRDVKVDAPDFAVPGDDFLTLVELKQRLAGTHEGLKTLAKRSEEHTSELQSRGQLVCRLLLEKNKSKRTKTA